MVLYLFNKLLCENIKKKLKNQKLNIDRTAWINIHSTATSLNWKATVLNKLYPTNDLLFVKLVFQNKTTTHPALYSTRYPRVRLRKVLVKRRVH